MRKIVIILLILSANQIYCQNIFTEKFDLCNTTYFETESDSVLAKPISDFVNVIATNLNDDKVKTIRGILSLQIIVDEDGRSCLLSVENNTNIETDELFLKTSIDDNLLWHKLNRQVSVIVAIKFYGNEVEIKRIGISKEKGFHELSN
ncbi:hypothetical protein B4Q04_14580 [Zobellia sp. OII3]|uniref:hypothetical protein n=1 Tax=Zobellia sp. OII3 TaxID=2034520 RepID=UPI000B529E61|nr:hypothetical protein [Zobellia sp. OII3]OWW24540.1 hypothetical protein B4Q04_14580 [Zobellia sp. OII3]